MNWHLNLFDQLFQDALVHLGAKYAPCMRHDLNIYKNIEVLYLMLNKPIFLLTFH